MLAHSNAKRRHPIQLPGSFRLPPPRELQAKSSNVSLKLGGDMDNCNSVKFSQSSRSRITIGRQRSAFVDEMGEASRAQKERPPSERCPCETSRRITFAGDFEQSMTAE